MTYEKIVEKVKKALAKVDASGVKGHLAVQVDVYGEGEGAFYIEVKDGKVDVQPYEYFDHDLRIRCTGDEIIAIAEGKKKIIEEVAAENVEALRNVSRLGDFDLVFVGKQIKNKAAKKTKASVPVEKAEKKAVKKEAAKEKKDVKKELPEKKKTAKTDMKVTKKETKEDKNDTKVAKKMVKEDQKPKTEKKVEKAEKKIVKKEVKADTPVKEKKKPGRKPKIVNV
ncbi:MAG: hypothetical protein IJL20_09280 [Lachnospiraceae bacterium]|nr:hypothetical protein [Lachnospiraceae bacterium]